MVKSTLSITAKDGSRFRLAASKHDTGILGQKIATAQAIKRPFLTRSDIANYFGAFAVEVKDGRPRMQLAV
ncbi:MAG: hypothetical protein Q7R78_03180 [bacterium]|nr:hypothetical protein [bacterium]